MSPLLLSLAALVLLSGGALLLRGGESRVQARLKALRPARPQADATAPDIRVTAADERGPLERALRLLGYNPAIPRSHALPLPIVLLLAAVPGLGVALRGAEWLGPAPAALLGLALALATAMLVWQRQARRYRGILFHQLPEVLGQLLRAVRAGLPVNEALRQVNQAMAAPSQGEFAKVVGETGLGVSLEQALWNLHHRVGLTEHAFLAITVGLQGQTGGNLTESLGNLAEMTRKRVSAAAKARALAAEARTSAVILALLPFVCALALLYLNPGYLMVLFHTPLGNQLLLAFCLLLSCGLVTIRWLIQRSTQD